MLLLGAAFTLATAYGLGILIFRRIPLPHVILMALGAAVLSVVVYLLLLAGIASAAVFAALGIPAIASLILLRPTKFSAPPVEPLDAFSRWILIPILIVFGVFYLVHALAPEIQPDAIAYHLGLPAECLRLKAFPKRIGFFEILPQGFEMLFTVAYSIGRDSAAKLVHFGFLLATLPLIVLTARRLKLSDSQAYSAAVLYFAAPVVGISGTCAYNDAALACFTLATFYLLLLWRDKNMIAYALAAGLTAGFCAAIKFTGLLVPPLALVFILYTRRAIRPAFLFSLGAAAMVAPWMARAMILIGNPLAPLFNTWFPNRYFNAVTDQTLSRTLSTYGGFHWTTAPWDWAISGRAEGVAGPLILMLPLALLALRKPAGRLLLAASILLLVPVLYNVGARFMMPALPFLALALATALPRPAILACALLQAIICFPPVILRLEDPQSWTLKGFPWRAALRLEPEAAYLNAATGDYQIARFVEENTKAADYIYALNPIAKAYTTRDVLEYWHSNRAQQLMVALQVALSKASAGKVRAEWPATLLSGIRIVSTADLPKEWRIYEARLYSPGGFIYASPQWDLAASPNLWEAPGAFDGNRTTSWSTLVPQRRGMFLEAAFNHPQLLNSIELLIAKNYAVPEFVIEGRQAATGKWQLLADAFNTSTVETGDLRHEATNALKRAGFTHIVVNSDNEGLGQIGADMVKHPVQWGVRDIGARGPVHLIRLL